LKNKVLFLVFIITLATVSYAQIPTALKVEGRVPPPNSVLMDLYKLMSSYEYDAAVAMYDSVQQVYLKAINVHDYLYTATEFSYLIYYYGRNQILAHEILLKALNTVDPEYTGNTMENLIAFYTMSEYSGDNTSNLRGSKQEGRLKWYDIFLNNNNEHMLPNLTHGIRLYYGSMHYFKGRMNKAWEQWNYCLNDSRYYNDPFTYFQLGFTIFVTDASLGIMLLEKAYKLYGINGDFNSQLYVGEYLAWIYHENKMYPQAINHAKLSIDYSEIVLKLKSQVNIYSSPYYSISESLIKSGRFVEAENYIDEMEQKRLFFADSVYIPYKVAWLRGLLLLDKGKADSSLYYFNKSKADWFKLFGTYLDPGIGNVFFETGKAYYKKGEYKKACENLETTIKTISSDQYCSILDNFKLVEPTLFSRNLLADYLEVLEFLLESQKALYLSAPDKKVLLEMVDLCNYTRRVIKEKFNTTADEQKLLELSKQLKLINYYGIFASHYMSLFDIRYVDTAFMLSATSHSFNLNYLRGLKEAAKAGKNDSLIYRVCKLNVDLHNTSELDSLKRFDLNLDMFRTKTLLHENADLGIELDELRPDIDSLKHYIKDKHALLNYFIKDSIVYSICYTKGKSKIALVEFPDIDKAIKSLKRGVKSGSFKAEIQQVFFTKLISPFLDDLKGVDRLLILADEKLGEVPFELFINSNKTLLIDQFSITYLNSSKNIHFNDAKLPSSLFAIAPGFEKNREFMANNINRSTMDAEDVFDVRNTSMLLQPILYSISEVNSIANLFKQKRISSLVITADKATEENYKKRSPNNDIIHIATHGVSRNEYESGLFFTWNNKSKEDGFLRLPELYGMDLNADLVVLSACKTAIGEVKEGEGVMALPRGFIYAGVPNVIASLWKVHDEKTKYLMVQFYSHLLSKRVSYAEALRLAKLDCIQKGFSPIDWAGFVLIAE